MRLLFFMPKTFFQMQVMPKTSQLAFLQLVVQPKLHSTHQLALPRQPPTQQRCNFVQAPTLLFCFPFNKHAFPPSPNVFPPTQQRCNNFNPAYRSIPQLPNLLFVSFQSTFLFHCHQMPQTHFKTTKSACFSTAINLHFPQVCQVVEQTFAVCPKAVLCVPFCQAKYALFARQTPFPVAISCYKYI